jgi:hypothetical protein
MQRKAILIAASRDEHVLNSAYADSVMFKAFLQSDVGGAWEDGEIVLNTNPTREQIQAAVTSARNADYTLTLFVGQGELRKGALPWEEMQILLGSGELVTERELNSGTQRCALIFDCGNSTTNQDGEALPSVSFEISPTNGARSNSRHQYEAALGAAERGLTKVYATPAGNSLHTRSFAQHLLHQSHRWAEANRGTLNLGDAVLRANAALEREGYPHAAQYLPGRRLHDFPFAVHP